MIVIIQGVDVIYLHAKNGEQTGKWYEEVLGLKVKFKTSDSSWQEFDLDACSPARFAIESSLPSNTSQVEQQSIIISFLISKLLLSI